jgi:uncharacterized DUF497 family protein
MARFEWDPAKAKRNLAKHGVIRIISARRALRQERQRYEDQAD